MKLIRKEHQNTYARIVERVGCNQYRVWNGEGFNLGTFTFNELEERKDRFHLETKSKNKNYKFDFKKRILKIKPVDTSDMKVTLGVRDDRQRYLDKVENYTDNMQGIESVWHNSLNPNAGEELVDVYMTNKEVWDSILEHFEYFTRNQIEKMEWQDFFDNFIGFDKCP